MLCLWWYLLPRSSKYMREIVNLSCQSDSHYISTLCIVVDIHSIGIDTGNSCAVTNNLLSLVVTRIILIWYDSKRILLYIVTTDSHEIKLRIELRRYHVSCYIQQSFRLLIFCLKPEANSLMSSQTQKLRVGKRLQLMWFNFVPSCHRINSPAHW